MKPTIQIRTALLNKQKAERRLMTKLNEWVYDVSTHYRIGNTVVNANSIVSLRQMLRQFYYQSAKNLLKFDIREYKARAGDTLKTRIAKSVSQRLGVLYADRLSAVSNSITQTANQYVKQTTKNMIENAGTELEGRRTIGNYLRAHKATISVTESQWVIETSRMEIVKSVDKTLKIFANEVAELLESGMLKDAGKLAGEGLALGDLPLSMRQGDLLNVVIDNTKKVVDPIEDRENIQTIRQEAEGMGRENKRWETVGDGKVRESHQKANGQIVGIDEPFQLTGGQVRYPGDGSMGADLSELVNCIVSNTEVETDSKIHKLYRRQYSGEVIRVSISNGMSVTVTPNHPIFTDQGWIEAKFLDHTYKIGCLNGVNKFIKFFSVSNPQKENIPSIIEKIYNFAFVKYVSRRITGANSQFHGDGTASDVNVIFINGFFKNRIKPLFDKHIGKFFNSIADFGKMFFIAPGPVYKNFITPFFPTDGGVCFFGKSFSFTNGSMLHAHKHGFTSISGLKPYFSKSVIDNTPVNVKHFRYFFNGHSRIMEFNEIIDIKKMDYFGHVYNLQTKNNYYMASDNITNNNGNVKKIILHNCRCVAVYE